MKFLKLAAPLVAVLAIAACSAGGSSNVPSSAGSSLTGQSAFTRVPEWQAKHLARAACPQVVGKPTCLALISEKHGVSPLSGCNPSSTCGWTATQLETAYNLTGSLGKGSGQVVAVIEAGDDPDAATTFSTYRTQYKLGTGTLVKYNQSGQQSNYPPNCEDYGWCIETDLDIEMVAAACPKCTVYLMEAGSSISDFETAEAEAVTLGATILSNSWICYGNDDCGDSNFQNYFDTKGIAYLAASGDDAYNEIGAPSVLDTVIAVGGTQLAESGSKYSESDWIDAGAGCASGVTKPSWQHDPDCSARTDSDVSSEAGCSPAVAEYSDLYGGWFGVCGTSVASPFTAGVIGLAGNATSLNAGESFWKLKKKALKKDLHDIKTGSDGSCGNYLCEAGLTKKNGGYKTYSGPGGWGSPNGISAY
ncbi:MAG TPA: S8 family serine peptidase [Candidatus Cybelea sp.]|nr:S8 family serine peptidase [Candidatus Cybelea sp.]